MLKMLQLKRQPAPELRTWERAKLLVERLAALADKRFSDSREFFMWTNERCTRITMKVRGTEFTGEGQSPWEAAAVLATNAGEVACQVQSIINELGD